jgi:PTS system mannitol-specific IIC component
MIGGGLPNESPTGWPWLVTDVVDQVGDRVDDPRGQEREPLGLLAGGDARQDQDGLESSLDPGDDVGVHAVADHHRRLTSSTLLGLADVLLPGVPVERYPQAAGFEDVSVVNVAIANLNDSYDLVVTHQDLTLRARDKTPSAQHVSVSNFMASPKYDEIVHEVQQTNTPEGTSAPS